MDRNDITEILLKVALNTITLTPIIIREIPTMYNIKVKKLDIILTVNISHITSHGVIKILVNYVVK